MISATLAPDLIIGLPSVVASTVATTNPAASTIPTLFERILTLPEGVLATRIAGSGSTQFRLLLDMMMFLQMETKLTHILPTVREGE